MVPVFGFISVCFCFIICVQADWIKSIKPCKDHNKECLIKMGQEAFPKVAVGIPELGIPSSDPLHVDQISADQDDLKLKLTDVTFTGASKMKVINMEINLEKSIMYSEFEAPCTMKGQYEASGNLFGIPIEGKGACEVYTKNIKARFESQIKIVDGTDGQKHWSLGEGKHSFEPIEKIHFKMENLFNGDKSRSDPVEKLMDKEWKLVVLEIGKPVVAEFLDHAHEILQRFFAIIPVD